MQGFYLHIPFCVQKCNYCDFVITTRREASFKEQLIEALVREIHQAKESHGRLLCDTLYFGGGTPSVLSGEEMEKILSAVHENFDFIPGYEFSFEVNPTDVETDKFEVFKSLGINRISLGAQAFQDTLLLDMGRQHKSGDIERSFRLLRKLGYDHISMDLMIGLPGQTLRDLDSSLQHILMLEPEQVTVYDLEIEKNTTYGAMSRSGRLKLPDDSLHYQMNALAGEKLTAAGYVQYELSTFAKPGYECRHNLIYWNNAPYLGVGPGAFSYMNGIRSRMAASVTRYLEKNRGNDWGPDEFYPLSTRERDLETLITGMRLKEGFDLERLKFLKQDVLLKCMSPEMSELVIIDQGRLFLTERGKCMADRVMSELL